MQGPPRSQGGVKFPTGGMRALTRKPASGLAVFTEGCQQIW